MNFSQADDDDDTTNYSSSTIYYCLAILFFTLVLAILVLIVRYNLKVDRLLKSKSSNKSQVLLNTSEQI